MKAGAIQTSRLLENGCRTAGAFPRSWFVTSIRAWRALTYGQLPSVYLTDKPHRPRTPALGAHDDPRVSLHAVGRSRPNRRSVAWSGRPVMSNSRTLPRYMVVAYGQTMGNLSKPDLAV